MWTAPEHIDFNKGEKSGFSQKGDVYSYGIILQEISTRCKPFLDCNLDCKGNLAIITPTSKRKPLIVKCILPLWPTTIFDFSFDIKQLDANTHSRDSDTHARDLMFSEIIQRVVAYEDPPFRPDLTRVDVRPEFVDLIVDCWCDDPEERPHFFRIVERLKKISGRSVVLQVILEVLDTTLPIIRLRRRLGRCCVELHCGAVLAGRLTLTQLYAYLQNGQYLAQFIYHFLFW